MKLVTENIGLAYKIADQRWIAHHDRGDVRQEACLALIEAARCFRSDGSASFTTFATQVIERRLRDRMKFMARQMRWDGLGPMSFDARLDTDDGEASTLHDLVPSSVDVVRNVEIREEFRRLSRAMASLTGAERDALAVVASGVNYHGNKHVDNASQRAKRKLREAA